MEMELLIAPFRQRILDMYAITHEGMTEEQLETLKTFQQSPDSILCALEVIREGTETELSILFTSIDIILKFILSPNWCQCNEQDAIILTLLEFLKNRTDPASVITKILVCISNIVVFDFQRFTLLQEIPPNHQIDFLIIFIEELENQLDSKVKTISDDDIEAEVSYLSSVLQDLLSTLELSSGFLRLLKASLFCFESHEIVSKYLGQMTASLEDPELVPHCANVVRSILIETDPYDDVRMIPEFIPQLIDLAIKLVIIYWKNMDFDVACELWSEMINMSPNIFEMKAFAHAFFDLLFQFLSSFPESELCLPEFESLIPELCDLLTENENIPVYPNELQFLFGLLIKLSQMRYSIGFDRGAVNIFNRIPEIATLMIQSQLSDPIPGLFLVACQCQLDARTKLELANKAIELKDVIPPFIMLTFISKMWKSTNELSEAWFLITIDLIAQNTSMAMNILTNFLQYHPAYIQRIPSEAIGYILAFLDASDVHLNSIQSIWIPSMKLFKTISPVPLEDFLSRLQIKIPLIIVNAMNDIANSKLPFDNTSILARLKSLNKELGHGDFMKQFKGKLCESIMACADGFMTENSDNENLKFEFASCIPETINVFQEIAI